MFKVGDFVENIIYGKGVVTKVYTAAPIIWYPVEVTFSKVGGSIKIRFNQEGKPSCFPYIEKYIIHKLGEPMKQECKFKVCDRVVSKKYGIGVVVQIGSLADLVYPVVIMFDKLKAPKNYSVEGKEYINPDVDTIETIDTISNPYFQTWDTY